MRIKDELIQMINYRPFDIRKIVYTGKTKGFIGWPRHLRSMRHFIEGENVGLITIRNSRSSQIWREVFVTNTIASSATPITTLDKNFIFPLYLYPETEQQNLDNQQTRKPNLAPNIVKTIAAGLGLTFTPEKQTAEKTSDKTFAPIDLLDYIYAVLHSPAYREKYKAFLKIDFPRVPYPTDKKQFRQLIKLGGQLRTLHLLESPTLDTLITGYPETGDHIITKPEYKITDPKKRFEQTSTSTKNNTSATSPKPPGTFTSAATNPPKNGSKTANTENSPPTMSSTIKKSSLPCLRPND